MKNIEHISTYQKFYREKNHEARAISYAKNKESISKYDKQYRVSNPHKKAAHASVRKAIKSGDIVQQQCCVCGSDVNVEAHHEDYSKHLDIAWMCRTHHQRLHSENNHG